MSWVIFFKPSSAPYDYKFRKWEVYCVPSAAIERKLAKKGLAEPLLKKKKEKEINERKRKTISPAFIFICLFTNLPFPSPFPFSLQ